MPKSKYDIFISYSRRDTETVNRIVEALESAGYVVWLDREGITTGDSFKAVIVTAIENSKTVVFISSASSNASMWTAKEIGIAVARGKAIIPVKIDDSQFNKDVEFDLINLDFIDLPGGKFKNGEHKNHFLSSIDNKIKAAPIGKLNRHSGSVGKSRKTTYALLIALPLLMIVTVFLGMLMHNSRDEENVKADATLYYASLDAVAEYVDSLNAVEINSDNVISQIDRVVVWRGNIDNCMRVADSLYRKYSTSSAADRFPKYNYDQGVAVVINCDSVVTNKLTTLKCDIEHRLTLTRGNPHLSEFHKTNQRDSVIYQEALEKANIVIH